MNPKVPAGAAGVGVGGAIVVILVWALGLGHIDVPAEVASALTTLVGAVIGFLAGWATPGHPAAPPNPAP